MQQLNQKMFRATSANNWIDEVKDLPTPKMLFSEFWVENEKLTNSNLIKPYLYKAVKNRSLNYIKREKRKSGLDEIFNIQNSEFENFEEMQELKNYCDGKVHQ